MIFCVNKKYSLLFEPINIGKLKVKNRIVMAPMGNAGMSTLDGCFACGQQIIIWLEPKAG